MSTRFSPKYGFQGTADTDDIIRETCGGFNAGPLVFPGVSSCTTISIRDGQGNMAGLHLAMLDSLPMAGRLLEYIRQNLPAGISAIAHVGRLNDSSNGWNSGNGFDWPTQAATVKAALNAGPMIPTYFVETPQGGYDVRVSPAMGAGFDVSLKPQSGHPPNFTDGWMPVPVHRLP